MLQLTTGLVIEKLQTADEAVPAAAVVPLAVLYIPQSRYEINRVFASDVDK